MDFANDDNFHSAWQSNPKVKEPWYEIDFRTPQTFNTVVVFENKANIKKYKLEYYENKTWKTLFEGENLSRVKLHRFPKVHGDKIRIAIETFDTAPSIAEFEVYNEVR
jgi:alpha-L-fucosidase